MNNSVDADRPCEVSFNQKTYWRAAPSVDRESKRLALSKRLLLRNLSLEFDVVILEFGISKVVFFICNLMQCLGRESQCGGSPMFECARVESHSVMAP